MSVELRDFRGRITPETWAALEVESRMSGVDMQAIVRQLLHDWALKKIEKASLLDRLLRSQGITRDAEGAKSASRGRVSDFQDSGFAPRDGLSG